MGRRNVVQRRRTVRPVGHYYSVWLVAKPRWRAVCLLIIGFGGGLYIGIETTAEGYLILPLGVLEKQLHELWGLPI